MTQALDLAVLPSLREAQGVALLEAMAARVPVVASRVGGIPETIRDGNDGLLVPPADPEALAAAIVRIARDGDLRERRRGRTAPRGGPFNVVESVQRVESVYTRQSAGLRTRGRSGSRS